MKHLPATRSECLTSNAASKMKSVEFRVVIAYEDFGAAIRAQGLTGRLAACLRPEFAIVSHTWKFDYLGDQRLGEQAATAALKAEMIVIATGARDLPGHVKRWLESWLVHKRGGLAALVALLQPDSHGEPPPLCLYLRQAAEKGSMDFLYSASYGRESATVSRPRASAPDILGSVTQAMKTAVNRSRDQMTRVTPARPTVMPEL